MDNKSRLIVGGILATMMTLTLFLLPTGAIGLFPDITLGNNLFNPLGDANITSFEYRAGSMYQPPTGWYADGGRRWLATDINGDGITDLIDYYRVCRAFGKPLTDTACDLDNDGDVDLNEVFAVAKDYGKYRLAIHGESSWYIGSDIQWNMSRYVEPSCLEALEGQTVMFGFWFSLDQRFSYDGGCRAEIEIKGAFQNDHKTGVWIVPQDDQHQWLAAYVNASVYLRTSSIRVIVRGYNIRCYVDCCVLTVRASHSYEGPCGSISLGCDIFSFQTSVGPTLDGEIKCKPAVYAEASNGYYIKWVKLTVEKKSDETLFSIYIPFCSQSNNRGFIVDPETQEELQADEIFLIGIGVSFVISALMSYGLTAAFEAVGFTGTIAVLTRVGMTTILNSEVRSLLLSSISQPEKGVADISNGNSVWETWGYPWGVHWDTLPQNYFVKAAGGSYDVIWSIDTDGGSFFDITVSAEVCLSQSMLIVEDYVLYENIIYSTDLWLSIAA